MAIARRSITNSLLVSTAAREELDPLRRCPRLVPVVHTVNDATKLAKNTTPIATPAGSESDESHVPQRATAVHGQQVHHHDSDAARSPGASCPGTHRPPNQFPPLVPSRSTLPRHEPCELVASRRRGPTARPRQPHETFDSPAV